MHELHTCWQDQCFDPDGDGLYESYINTWPTDSVWYNGGGSCEETCYAYRAHQAAMELQNKRGNWKAAEKHRKILEKIRHGFFQLLWIKEGGYPAKKREKGGHERLHSDPWLYNCFLPVDVEITDSFDSITALWYSKWALENVPQPGGGRTVWLSNWVPSIWSVRQNAAGENFQLAYGFFKAGLAEEGYQVLRGTIIRDGYCALQPGHICSEAASLLARAVICGLHGYRPDYPNGKVEFCPQYPASWDHADMKTPSFSCTYRRNQTTVRYAFELTKAAQVTLKLPIYGEQLCKVKGADSWRVEPGFGCTLLILEIGQSSGGEIEVQTSGKWSQHPPISFPASPGESLCLSSDEILTLVDPQGIITKWELEEGKVQLQFGQYSGPHLLFFSCLKGKLPYYRIVEATLSHTAQEQQTALLEQVEKEESPLYHPFPMERIFNGDVRTLFQQKYLSPRPKGIHLSIGSDGYSPWTFCYWKNNPPKIAFDPSLNSNGQLLYSRENIPFYFGGYEKNVAFTSLWDNWPTQITISVHRNASAAYILLLGTTNPMECHIANGVLRFYYEDGSCDQVELVPPRNFWTLAPYTCSPSSEEQDTNNDYCYDTDGFCLPAVPPETLSLGTNCRGIVLGCRLSREKQLACVQLESLSQEVVIGIAALTLRD